MNPTRTEAIAKMQRILNRIENDRKAMEENNKILSKAMLELTEIAKDYNLKIVDGFIVEA